MTSVEREIDAALVSLSRARELPSGSGVIANLLIALLREVSALRSDLAQQKEQTR